ncbi:MAG: putative S-adenosylmethionine-dependent methyltransferase/MSMEI2290 [Phenylobacterium sp.]|nr:putative S-adenosylmethionine-dependent methyltransferase/MSMEI2290 [Phenylobacterium sp.]
MAPMSFADAIRAPLVNLLVRLVFGVRAAVLERPVVRAVLRALGRPLIGLMHRLTRSAAPPEEPTPDMLGEPVLRLPLDYAPGRLSQPPRIAVLLHAFHLELLPEMAEHLRRIPFPADLFVSTDDEAKRQTITAAFAGWRAGAVEVRVVPNRGRNIAPQLVAFRDVYDSHSLLLLVHTKVSSHTDELAGWREFLLGNLLGSEAMVRGIVETFVQVPRLGVLAPRTYAGVRRHLIWGENYQACRGLAERLGFALYPDSPLDFPAGFMFWARAAALKPLLDLDLDIAAFEPEAGQKDGTLAHAVERLVFHACELGGFRWARAGNDVDIRPPEALYRAWGPRFLGRAVTDCGRTLLAPGRPPYPTRAPGATPPPDGEAKAAFRELCRAELDAFLASGDRLALPTSETPEVSILLVLFNQAELTYQCLRSLQFALDAPSELIVVDNSSSDRTGELLDRIDGARVIRNTENLHFLRGVNQGAALARGASLLLLNNDTRVTPGSVAAAVARLEAEPDLGAVGGKIELLDGALQEAGSIIWNDGSCVGYGRGEDPWAAEFQFRRDVDYCSGAFLMVRRDLFERLGRFDDAFAPAYYEETDLCMRIREAGFRVAYEPQVHISHFEFGSSTNTEAALALQQDHQQLFANRHAKALMASHRATGHALEARLRGPYAGRVLIVEDQIPYPQLGAGYPRALDLLRAAREAGWFVTLYPLVYADLDYAEAYGVLPPDVEIAAERGREGLESFLAARAGYYDAAIVSRPHNMQAFREALAAVPGLIPLERVIYDAEAIFALRDAQRDRLGLKGDAAVGVEAEVALADGVATVFAVNELEAANFRRAGCQDVRLLGHALRPAPTPEPFAARRDLLFVGALDEDESPNVDSLVFFVREVMPRLDALIGADYVLRVAGRSGSAQVRALASERVRLLGRVEDLTPLYGGSRLFVAPTRYAGGIPMKVHDTAAAGLPAVTTRLLARQLGWVDGVELLAADDPQAFAEACARLYADEGLWSAVREAALARVAVDCDPEAFRRTVAQTLEAVAGAAARRPSAR